MQLVHLSTGSRSPVPEAGSGTLAEIVKAVRSGLGLPGGVKLVLTPGVAIPASGMSTSAGAASSSAVVVFCSNMFPEVRVASASIEENSLVFKTKLGLVLTAAEVPGSSSSSGMLD